MKLPEVVEAIDNLNWRIRRMDSRLHELEEKFEEVFETKTGLKK